MEQDVKNLGQVAAVVFTTTAPTNTKILWYDEGEKTLKFYNNISLAWEPIAAGALSAGKVRVNSSDILDYLESKMNEDHFKVENLINGEGDLVPKISLISVISTGFFC